MVRQHILLKNPSIMCGQLRKLLDAAQELRGGGMVFFTRTDMTAWLVGVKAGAFDGPGA
jgi:hypothetical protein